MFWLAWKVNGIFSRKSPSKIGKKLKATVKLAEENLWNQKAAIKKMDNMAVTERLPFFSLTTYEFEGVTTSNQLKSNIKYCEFENI